MWRWAGRSQGWSTHHQRKGVPSRKPAILRAAGRDRSHQFGLALPPPPPNPSHSRPPPPRRRMNECGSHPDPLPGGRPWWVPLLATSAMPGWPRAQGAWPRARSPEEEAQGAHVPQVHAEHAADLLQDPRPLRLVPARGLRAIAVGEAQVGVHAGGRAGEQGERWSRASLSVWPRGKDREGVGAI